MNKKIIKKVLILVTLIMLVFVVLKILQIYAVFYSESKGTMSENVGKWTIVVNGTNISTPQVQNFEINELNVGEDEHVKVGKIAPGLTGNFDIIIDPSDTDVSIKYEIYIDKTNLVNSKAQIVSVKEIANNNLLIETSPNVFTGVIPLEKIKVGNKDVIETTLVWEDNGTTDKEDTLIGTVENPKINIPITVKVSQYLGEAVQPYE